MLGTEHQGLQDEDFERDAPPLAHDPRSDAGGYSLRHGRAQRQPDTQLARPFGDGVCDQTSK